MSTLYTARRRRLALALATLVALAVSAGIAELALRRAHARKIAAIDDRERWLGRCTRAAASPLLYENVPFACGNNSRGFHDREHAVPKPPGVYRVVLIGDSVVTGVGLEPDDRRFSSWLEEELARRRGAAVDVVVLARTGYNTEQELYLLEHEAPRYQPDLVLWSYVLNDPADAVQHDANGELGFYYYRPASALAAAVSRAWFIARERWRGHGCPVEYHRFLHCAYAPEVERAWARLAEWSRAAGVPVVVAIEPIHPSDESREGHPAVGFASYAEYPLADLHRELARSAAAHHLEVVDVTGAFAGATAAEVSIPGDPWHPSARGHERIGRFLAAQLSAAAR